MMQMEEAYYYRRPARPEENIYNLIPQVPEVIQRPPRYVSKYSKTMAPTASTFGQSTVAQFKTTNMAGDWQEPKLAHNHTKTGANFGPRNPRKKMPTQFLKKTSTNELPPPPQFRSRNLGSTIPSANSLPAVTSKSRTNYIKQNALAAITQQTGKRPMPQERFVNKPGFGKSPEYLANVRNEIQAERDYVYQAMEQDRAQYEMGMPTRRLLTEEERTQLLIGLKDKWETVNKEYQTMTHRVALDTMGSIRRKEEYEAELTRLEKSVEKLSKQYVFVDEGGM